MKRSTLRTFLRSLAVASLPVSILAACEPEIGSGLDVDLTLRPIVDMTGDLTDMCLAMPPVTKRLPYSATMPLNCARECEYQRPSGYLGFVSCMLVNADSEVDCTYGACGFGRRPEGFVAASVEADNPIGAYFAQAAQLEAASVPAFERLARELEGHGAPEALIEKARRAAREEARHTCVMTALAHRFGARPGDLPLLPMAERSLEALAIENRIEGCVGETWGAIVATWQAQTAQDPRIRAALRRIAADETRHAELAAAVDDWAQHSLPSEARRRLDAARLDALTRLERSLDAVPAPALVTLAGVPTTAQARHLFAAARTAVFLAA